MAGIVTMATRSITAEVGLIVLRIGVHADAAVPVIAKSIGRFIEQSVIGGRRKRPASRALLHAVADGTDTVGDDSGGTDVINDSRRWSRVTSGTIKGQIRGFSMAIEATDRTYGTTNTVKSGTVAEGTRGLNIAGRVMEGTCVRSGPKFRMRSIGRVTAFTTVATLAVDADVKTRVTAGAACWIVGVTGLTRGQVGFGVRAVIRCIKIRAIHRMRCLARAVCMTTTPIDAGRKTAGRCAAALEINAMTAATGVDIGRRTMIDKPAVGMNADGGFIVLVTATRYQQNWQ